VSADLKRRALTGLLWSLVQSWGGRAATFVVFLVLARILSPGELGLMTVVTLIFSATTLIAEQGFGDAIVQRRNLHADDANLPLAFALGCIAVLIALVFLGADSLERWLNAPGLTPYLKATIVFAPLSTLYSFQEAFFRRDLEFKPLAIRMIVASVISGACGIALALAGAGIWSLVAQAIAMNAISVVWVWWKPKWRPSRRVDVTSFRELFRYSSHILGTRVLDLVAVRTIEVLIAAQLGVIALGFYTVGSRVYQTFVQLMFGAVQSVLLGTFAKVSDDTEKLRNGLFAAMTGAALVASPTFVLLAAVADEIVVVLFGTVWEASAAVMRPMMLLGALQCVQFVNGSVFAARGRPDFVLKLNVVKTGCIVLVLLFARAPDAGSMAVAMVLANLVTSPVVFWLGMRAVGATPADLARRLGPAVLCSACAYAATVAIRTSGMLPDGRPMIAMVVLGSAFVVTYAATVLAIGRGSIRSLAELLPGRLARLAAKLRP
jgi:O-antigen/teichoic acid export membrane protein